MPSQGRADNAPPVRQRAGQWLLAGVLLMLTLGALSAYGDLRLVRTHLQSFHFALLVPAVLIALLSHAIRALRFQLYLRRVGVHISHAEAGLVFFSGMSMAVTPGKVGEVIKPLLLKWTHGAPLAVTVPVVVVERVSDLVALLVLASWGGLLLVNGYASAWTGAALVALLVLLLSCCHRLLSGSRVMQRVPLLSSEARRASATRSLRRLTGLAPWCWGSALSLLAWLCQVGCLLCVVQGIAGATLSVQAAALIACAPLIVGVLSFIPGGLGAAEVTMTGLLLLLASPWVNESSAVVITALTRLVTFWLAVAIGGLALLVHRHQKSWTAGVAPSDV